MRLATYNGSAVTIYVTGTLDCSGTILTAGNLPSNLRIRVTSSSNVKLSGGGTYYMDLYAPVRRCC